MSGILSIRTITTQDLPALYDLVIALNGDKCGGYFERCLERQDQGELDFLIASADGVDVGYGIYNRVPKYRLYKALGIPEIQDLNIVPKYRNRGYATQVIAYCEDQARRDGHDQIGISVGLNADFGAAQRLYWKLGYQPDGQGVTYDRQPVRLGEKMPVDDNLCLMMVKDL